MYFTGRDAIYKQRGTPDVSPAADVVFERFVATKAGLKTAAIFKQNTELGIPWRGRSAGVEFINGKLLDAVCAGVGMDTAKVFTSLYYVAIFVADNFHCNKPLC